MTNEAKSTVNLALGRILRMASRPTKPGDVAEYNRCRAIVLDILGDSTEPYAPNWTRDRLCGAAGD